MKKFKDFILEEKPNAKPKAKGEADFVAQHSVEVTDKEDQAQNSAKVATKKFKNKADKENAVKMGEEKVEEKELSPQEKKKKSIQQMRKFVRQKKGH
tara:strand:+ start:2075 stop:2365 length:291 start_codon:yes stop_codon:yes gene_type:complete